jgi:hypothetical protein
MSSSFPFRPEETSEGFFESFIRISAVAWIVYITYRIIESDWVRMMMRGNVKISTPLKASILFSVTIISSYFTAGFRTRVYRQSIS